MVLRARDALRTNWRPRVITAQAKSLCSVLSKDCQSVSRGSISGNSHVESRCFLPFQIPANKGPHGTLRSSVQAAFRVVLGSLIFFLDHGSISNRKSDYPANRQSERSKNTVQHAPAGAPIERRRPGGPGPRHAAHAAGAEAQRTAGSRTPQTGE